MRSATSAAPSLREHFMRFRSDALQASLLGEFFDEVAEFGKNQFFHG